MAASRLGTCRAVIDTFDDAVMIGDSTWDAKAAKRAGLPTYAVRTGGFSVEELLDAGATRVYDSLEELQADLDAVVAADEQPRPAG